MGSTTNKSINSLKNALANRKIEKNLKYLQSKKSKKIWHCKELKIDLTILKMILTLIKKN